MQVTVKRNLLWGIPTFRVQQSRVQLGTGFSGCSSMLFHLIIMSIMGHENVSLFMCSDYLFLEVWSLNQKDMYHLGACYSAHSGPAQLLSLNLYCLSDLHINPHLRRPLSFPSGWLLALDPFQGIFLHLLYGTQCFLWWSSWVLSGSVCSLSLVLRIPREEFAV